MLARVTGPAFGEAGRAHPIWGAFPQAFVWALHAFALQFQPSDFGSRWAQPRYATQSLASRKPGTYCVPDTWRVAFYSVF